jgi:hypothetical protein
MVSADFINPKNKRKALLIYYIPWTGLDSCWAGSDPARWNRSWSEPRERPDTGSNRYRSVLHKPKQKNTNKIIKCFHIKNRFLRQQEGGGGGGGG